jgi:hypothetical protein
MDSSLLDRAWSTRGVVLGVALAVVLGAGAGRAAAAQRCPKDLDACLFVTGNADTNARDGELTLREALLLTQNQLNYGDLTPAEQAQVVLQCPPGWLAYGALPDTPPGFGGPGGIGGTSKLAIYFDPAVFCATCPGNTIVLTPPGFGGPGGIGGYGGTKILALPPLADPLATSVSGASKWVERVGMGYLPGVGEVPTTVIIDGSSLTAGFAGLWAGSRGVTLRGLTLRGFPGTAVELECKVADGVALDGVTFWANARDTEIVGCMPGANGAR